MDNITKYNLKTGAVSALGVILLFCVLSYLIAPDNAGFLNAINPLEFLDGAVFALRFGLGFPAWLSVVVIGLFSFLLFAVFLWIVRKVIK